GGDGGRIVASLYMNEGRSQGIRPARTKSVEKTTTVALDAIHDQQKTAASRRSARLYVLERAAIAILTSRSRKVSYRSARLRCLRERCRSSYMTARASSMLRIRERESSAGKIAACMWYVSCP